MDTPKQVARQDSEEGRISAERMRRRIESLPRYPAEKNGGGQWVRGIWDPMPETGALTLLAEARRIREGAAGFIKQSSDTEAFRGEFFGRDVFIKRHVTPARKRFAKPWGRPSRGARAWMASGAARLIGLEAQEVLGFVEVGLGGCNVESWYFAPFLEGYQDGRTWVAERWDGLTREERDRVAKLFANLLASLIRLSVVHPDAKASNVMLRERPTVDGCNPVWIDLEGLSFSRPGRIRVLRNLYQLNGSLFDLVDQEARRSFLSSFSLVCPWVEWPFVRSLVGAKTWWRLKKEQLGWAGK